MNAMYNDNQSAAAEIARLRTTGAGCRLKAVESQHSPAFTLCAIAEAELRYGRPDEAIKVVNKIRYRAETILFYVDEASHLPSTAISGLRRQLTQLEKRINEIEWCLRSQ